MGKSSSQDKEARKKRRKGLSLKQCMITESLRTRYNTALILITQFWTEANILVSTLSQTDSAVACWLEHIFSEGEPKSLASDGLASLHFYLPELCGSLRHSWKLVKTWQKLEPPTRMIPISPLLCQAFAGACVVAGFLGEAAALLLGFDAMLRPGELYHVLVKDITFYKSRAVVALRDTKTGRRRGAAEMVVVESRVANKWLRRACHQKPGHHSLITRSPADFRSLFANLVEHFELDGLYAIYSLRRGGATWDFLSHNSIERTLLRGRWSSTSTARIYLQDTVATVSLLKLTPLQTSYARLLARHL